LGCEQDKRYNRAQENAMRLLPGLLMAGLLGACSMSATAPTATPLPTQIVIASPEESSTRWLTNTPAPPTATRFVMPTPPPVPTSVCEDTPRPRLVIGERGWVLDDDPRPVRIRSLSSVESDVVASIPPDGIFFVIDGPRCEEGYAWYFVRYQRIEGWIAEGDPTGYYVEPYPPAG
jgi:hypothetical protein